MIVSICQWVYPGTDDVRNPKIAEKKKLNKQGKEKGLIRWWVTEVLNFSLACVFFTLK